MLQPTPTNRAWARGNARRSVLLPVLLTMLLMGIGVALPTFAQQGEPTRALEAGTPLDAALDNDTIAEVFTFAGDAGQTVAVTVSNTAGVPLAVLITDVEGATLAQGVDTAATGETLVNNIELPEDGIYYVTVFKAAGVNSINEVEFSIAVDVVTGDTTVEPTAAPQVTAEATADASAEATVAPEVTASAESTASPEATVSPEGTQDATINQVLTTGGLTVTLSWSSTDDLDLEVRDPVGGSLYWRTPQVESGGTISANANQGCVTPVAPAQEVATWSPGGLPAGSYEVLVYFQQSCNNNAPTTFTLTPVVDGVTLDPIEATILPSQTFVTAFVVNLDAPAAFTGRSGIEADQILPAPAAELLANANPLEINTTVNGFIGNDSFYQAYTIDVPQNELVTIAMEATGGGSLDTFVALLDAAGNIVRSNDDRADGDTNSLIGGALISEAGTYTVVATRFAKSVGGTEGDYALTVTSEASNLPAEFSNLPRGSIEVRLLWRTNADLQLLLRDPAGNSVFDDIPTIASGGTLAAQGNVNCRVSEGTPFSYIYFPLDLPVRPGPYEIEVWFQSDCGDTTPVTFNLFAAVNGQEIFTDTAAPLLNERYLTSFTVEADGTVSPSDGGIITGLASLDYQSELTTATAILPGAGLNGSITAENKFDVYTFLGGAGEVVNISMDNTGGILDPTLYLIGPSGGLLVENDDAVAGENTNSLIADFTLPEDGTYIIIATHFGAQFGGTTGAYRLTLTPRS